MRISSVGYSRVSDAMLFAGSQRLHAANQARLELIRETELAAKSLFSRVGMEGIWEGMLVQLIMKQVSGANQEQAAQAVATLQESGIAKKNYKTGFLTPAI